MTDRIIILLLQILQGCTAFLKTNTEISKVATRILQGLASTHLYLTMILLIYPGPFDGNLCSSSQAMVFPVVMYGCESWIVKKAERRRIDAFELWC